MGTGQLLHQRLVLTTVVYTIDLDYILMKVHQLRTHIRVLLMLISCNACMHASCKGISLIGGASAATVRSSKSRFAIDIIMFGTCESYWACAKKVIAMAMTFDGQRSSCRSDVEKTGQCAKR